jgi:TonB family protein
MTRSPVTNPATCVLLPTKERHKDTQFLIKWASKAPMLMVLGRSRLAPAAPHWRATVILSTLLALSVPLSLRVRAQQPQPETPQQPATPAPTSDATPAPAQNTATPAQTSAPSPDATQAPTQPAPPEATQAPASAPAATPAINEDELKQLLVGKQVYLRKGYLGDSLNFDEHGHIVSHSPQGSYTLSIIQIDHVRITKHKVELEGIRYGLHFNEQLAYEDSSTAYDKVRITPKKKLVKITIDREMVIKPKQKKESAKEKAREAKLSAPAAAPAASTTASPAQPAAPETAAAQPSAPAAPDQPAQSATSPAASAPASPAASTDSSELSEADQLKASIAAAPEAERPADPNSVTTTTSQAHANKLLRDALDAIFAPGLDKRMMAAMPDCWKLYYQAVADKADYRPSDPSILRQNTVDQKALLLTSFEPDSNDFAQSAGVAGMALYHTIIGADGKPGEIAVARPIGFGLDENAVAAIRKAKFSPAVKDGQPVPVMLDLVVQFRIFSKRTAVTSTPDPDEKTKPTTPALPGPYSVQHPN